MMRIEGGQTMNSGNVEKGIKNQGNQKEDSKLKRVTN